MFSSPAQTLGTLRRPLLEKKRRIPSPGTSSTWSTSSTCSPASDRTVSTSSTSRPPNARSRSHSVSTLMNDDWQSMDLSRFGKAATLPLGAILNLTAAVCGVGILSIPYAFRMVGWCCILIVIGGGAICGMTAILLAKCLDRCVDVVPVCDRLGEPVDYALIGQAAYGALGRKVVKITFLLDIFFILISFLVANGSNLQILLPDYSKPTLMIGSCVVCYVMTFCPFHLFSYFSFVGHVAMCVAIVLVVVTGFSLPEMPDAESYSWFHDYDGVSQAVGLIIFCNVAHSTIPSIYQNTPDKERFSDVVNVSFGICSMINMFMGCAGYVFFCNHAAQNVIWNIGRDLSKAVIVGMAHAPTMASIGFVIKLHTSYPLYAYSFVSHFEAFAGVTEKTPLSYRAVLRAIVMSFTCALAISLRDHMAHCIALTGSLLSMCTAILFPTLFYYKLHSAELSNFRSIGLGCIFCLGFYFQVTGTYNSVRQIFDM